MGTYTTTVVSVAFAENTNRARLLVLDTTRCLALGHDNLFSSWTKKYDAQLIHSIGPQFLWVIPSATSAVRATTEFQADADGLQRDLCRIALATGDVEEYHGNIVSRTVSLAKGLQDEVPPGQIWLDEGAFHAVGSAKLPLEYVGRLRLTDFEDEQDVYRAVPDHRMWLPPDVVRAKQSGALVLLRPGRAVPAFPPNPTIVLDRFTPDSLGLQQVIEKLPPLPPDRLYLRTHDLSQWTRTKWLETGRKLLIGTEDAMEQALVQAATAGEDGLVTIQP